jgi:hypothetical protein
VRVEKFGDGHGIAAIAKHADFDRGDFTIVGQAFELRAQLRAGRIVNGFDALRVLHRERSDRGDAVAAVRGESFQISSRARAAGRIETGDGEKNWRRRMRVSVRSHRVLLLVR